MLVHQSCLLFEGKMSGGSAVVTLQAMLIIAQRTERTGGWRQPLDLVALGEQCVTKAANDVIAASGIDSSLCTFALSPLLVDQPSSAQAASTPLRRCGWFS
jgi:hypothetical protein